jgi:hypothetical protein
MAVVVLAQPVKAHPRRLKPRSRCSIAGLRRASPETLGEQTTNIDAPALASPERVLEDDQRFFPQPNLWISARNVQNWNLLNGNVQYVSHAQREKLAFSANHQEGQFES